MTTVQNLLYKTPKNAVNYIKAGNQYINNENRRPENII